MDLFFEKFDLGLGLRVTAEAIIPHFYTSYVRLIYSFSGVPKRFWNEGR